VEALLLTGVWDRADTLLHEFFDPEVPATMAYLTTHMLWLASLRGDLDGAAAYAALLTMHAGEDPQLQAAIAVCEAFLAAAQHRPADALRLSGAVLVHAPVIGIGHVFVQWAWPLAARSAHALGDTDEVGRLLALLDGHPVGHVPRLLRAERVLVRARLTDVGDPETSGAFDAAVAALRQAASPYHLAHGLLDHAEYLTKIDAAGVEPLVAEARSIAEHLRARPLLDRAGQVAAWANEQVQVPGAS
jgi:hypothetical protein